MSSFFPTQEKKILVLSPDNVIRLTTDHIKALEKLITNPSQTYRLFGEVNLDRLLCSMYMCLGILDDDNRIVGAIFLNTYPNVKALPHGEWTHWAQTKYSLTDVNTRNTLWIHLILYDPIYTLIFLKPMLQYLFKIRNFLSYAILVIPPKRQQLDFTCDMGVQIIPENCRKGESQYLLLFCRKDFVTQYKIRRAVEEDNDDLVPLIKSYSSSFTELYGDFFIAEILITGKETGRQIIVAEHQGSAVAVLCVNPVVNYKILNEDFELVPYNGLKKPHPDDFADLDVEVARPAGSAEKIRPWKTMDEDLTTQCEKTDERREPSTLFEKRYGFKLEETCSYFLRLDKEDDTYYAELGTLSRIEEFIDKRTPSDQAVAEEEDESFVRVSASDSDQFTIVFTSASMFIFQEDDDVDDIENFDEPQSSSSTALLSQYLNFSRERFKDVADSHGDWVSAYSTTKGFSQKNPEFKGEENAFALEIVAALPNHEYGIVELFDAAFTCYTDRDYCIMTIPQTFLINKLYKYFARVVPRSNGTFPAELYVMHRNSIMSSITVEPGSLECEQQVQHLLATIPNSIIIEQQFLNSVYIEGSQYYSYICKADDQVIGIAIITEETDIEYLRSHYDLSATNQKIYRSGTQGAIESIVLSPIFQRHDNFFLREIHRLSEFDILYYRHSPYDTSDAYRERPLINVLGNLWPIMPLMQPQYDINILKQEECCPDDVVVEKREPFSLYVSTIPTTSINKHVINTRIVIVGCSNTALAFLQALLFKQHPHYMVTFNNITLLCANGLTQNRVSPKIRDVFIVKKNFWDVRYMDMINLKTYINIVHGKISRIDRKEQFVVINGNSFLDYDLLFLMCGEQFQSPTTGPNKNPFREKPENVLMINNALDAHNAVIKLKHLYHKYNDNNYIIIVYGHFLQAHAALHGLMAYGIPGYHLVLIEPFPYSMAMERRQRHNVSIYNDPEIDSVVYENIKNEGVKIYTSYYFIDWTYDVENNVITKVKFESRHKMLEVECMAMFFFNDKEISPRIHKVINHAGLVYDGRLVINANCQTNDPKIFGAGTLTKYSRKYYAPHMSHKFYNRLEIGGRLGLQIREMLIQKKGTTRTDGARSSWNFCIDRGDSLVPRCTNPIMRYCRLPGGNYYLSITKPGKRIPLESAVSSENYGEVLITGNCRNLSKQGYFQLHLNEFKRVETITCLNKDPIDTYNLHCIWGQHEKLLNSLNLRFEMVLITDLYEFFKEPWAYALYHSKFTTLMDDLNMLMTSSMGPSEESSLVSYLINLYKQSRWKHLTVEAKESLEEQFETLAYPKIIEHKVLAFIKTYLTQLPMYAHPVLVREILRDYTHSPLFT